MQTECVKKMKPGVEFYSLVTLSRDIALKGLMKLGVLHNGSFEEIKDAGTISAFFPHGVSQAQSLPESVTDIPISSGIILAWRFMTWPEVILSICSGTTTGAHP